jgi:hypothetical protein
VQAQGQYRYNSRAPQQGQGQGQATTGYYPAAQGYAGSNQLPYGGYAATSAWYGSVYQPAQSANAAGAGAVTAPSTPRVGTPLAAATQGTYGSFFNSNVGTTNSGTSTPVARTPAVANTVLGKSYATPTTLPALPAHLRTGGTTPATTPYYGQYAQQQQQQQQSAG